MNSSPSKLLQRNGEDSIAVKVVRQCVIRMHFWRLMVLPKARQGILSHAEVGLRSA